MWKKIIFIASFIIIMFSVTKQCVATTILAASYDVGNDYNMTAYVGGGYARGQTFTLETSGLLSEIYIALNCNYYPGYNQALEMKIHNTENGLPFNNGESELASITFESEFPPIFKNIVDGNDSISENWFGWTGFSVEHYGIYVNSGDILAVTLHSANPNVLHVGWTGTYLTNWGPTLYQEGQKLDLVEGEWIGKPFHSQMFQVYVTTPVPEPSTMLLLGFGLVGLAGVARKKMQK